MSERPDERRIEQVLQNEIDAIRLSAAQRTRVAARLGLEDGATTMATTSQPEPSIDATDTPHRLPRDSEEVPMRTYTLPSRRRHALEWLGGVAAIVVVALILVAIFREPTGDGETGVGAGAPPTATTAATTTAPIAQEPTATVTTIPATDDSMPTPDDSGVYKGLKVEQAQQLVPFPLRMPVALPDGFQGPDIMVVGPPFESGRAVYQVSSFYTLTDAQQPSVSLQYTQMNASFNPPSDDEAALVQIGGKDVWKSILPRTDALPIATYTWAADGVVYQVVAQIEGPITADTLEAFVASIPAAE